MFQSVAVQLSVADILACELTSSWLECHWKSEAEVCPVSCPVNIRLLMFVTCASGQDHEFQWLCDISRGIMCLFLACAIWLPVVGVFRHSSYLRQIFQALHEDDPYWASSFDASSVLYFAYFQGLCEKKEKNRVCILKMGACRVYVHMLMCMV